LHPIIPLRVWYGKKGELYIFKKNLIGTRTRLVCHKIINKERKKERKEGKTPGQRNKRRTKRKKDPKSKQKTTLKSNTTKCIFDTRPDQHGNKKPYPTNTTGTNRIRPTLERTKPGLEGGLCTQKNHERTNQPTNQPMRTCHLSDIIIIMNGQLFHSSQ
jgi:hypothetical protein